MTINKRDKYLYEHLSLIISEFEEAALQSQTREGIAVSALHPLQTMDQVLSSGSKALKMNRTKKVSKAKDSSSNSKTSTESNRLIEVEANPGSVPAVNVNLDQLSVDQELVGGDDALVDLSAISFDSDMQSLTGTSNLQDFLKECLGCDLRLTFDWQLKPIDLLSALGGLVADINLALDSLLNQLDPLNFLKNLCDLLNGLHWLCLPDLMAILMSLKLLLKSYLTFQLKINLDWTALIAPLLKLILDAIASLIQAIAGVLVGPLDCVLGVLKTIADLEKEISATIESGIQVANRIEKRVSDPLGGVEGSTLWKDLGIKEGSPGSASIDEQTLIDLVAPTPSSFREHSRTGTMEAPQWTEWSFPSGIALDANVKLPDAIKDPRFNFAHWTTKIILAVQEAKQYIMDLVRKIIGSLNSLEGLVSGSLSIHLGNLGMLLFVKDMITLVLLIIKLLRSNINIKDWCAELQAHPEILEDALTAIGSSLKVEVKDTNLVLSKGPKVLGTVSTCATDSQNPMIVQWIKELKNGL